MAVRLREALASIPVYRPGETPDECGPASAAKLSSNESPWEPPAPVVEAVAKAAATLNRYPDFYEVDLCERLAERYGLDAGQVSVDNGSGSLLQDAVRIVCDQGDEVLYCTPTFAAYEIDVVLAGAKPKTVPLGADWRYDVAALQAAVTDRTRMVLVCNPNNPTGTFLTTDELRELVRGLPDDVLVVIDEAYHEFECVEPQDASLGLLKEFDNVMILRTFSKAFGLAGMRIGYCLADSELVDAINKTIVEFSVSTPAQAAGLACLTPEVGKVLDERTQTIIRNREAFEDKLRAGGVGFIPSSSNFVMVPLPSSMEAFDLLKDAGIIARPFDDPEGIRVSVGTAEQMDRVAEVLVGAYGTKSAAAGAAE
ncbi:MAG: histidinol-phosphate transaminase [Atopobiaceae bacterium]|jgi:histidinol-phosphate aminotransferase|nr:histidinol-phosphate transaminase [Atopobiaceae bacterium]MCH4119981.1 histidinol-phosphate transaminase [Atopobiaceae bacterium]MCI1389340.1 histidinol-phosphate transaminase [Atopobiaceae bacterium]MCI1432403.1 histidinol-phosphate transaminase [Atopobiaceae bacterium]MCI1470861.1 histidinol-phosphate transaminase [Atopobiaceae bacterium]